ncbi:hypothetical protein OL229_09645 [Neisseriaceae bacterium JH1-16]|nr:hypothetical protein [Neisseriaceae bacterium JH1-16]
METVILLQPDELLRLPAHSQWECIGGAGWLSQRGLDITVLCGSCLDIDDPRGALIEAIGGPVRLRRRSEAVTPLLSRWLRRLGHAG